MGLLTKNSSQTQAQGKAGQAKKKKESLKVPKTVQDTIPYYAVYEDGGIIETTRGTFTKAYALKDINYQIARMQEQEEMFVRFEELLNGFEATMNFEISIVNKNMDAEGFERKVLLRPGYDAYDDLREEYNNMLTQKIKEGRNNMVKEKILTVATKARSYEDALATFRRLDDELSIAAKKIGGSDLIPISTMDRLELLHDIYNIGSEGTFGAKVKRNGKSVPAFTFESMRQMGLTTKDCIGPSSFEFKKDHFMIDDQYARVLYLKTLPSNLRDDVLAEITNVSCNMIASLHYEPVEPEKALERVRRRLNNINANILDRQKKASRSGYSTELLSPELAKAKESAEALLEDLTSKDQKMFMVTFVVCLFAESMESLNLYTELVQTTARRYGCSLKKLSYQQENGLTTALPLANNKLYIQRALTTESSAIFMPFSSQELIQTDGLYYGLNAISNNILQINRKAGKNMNGFILGTPGSGKSFSAKREMESVLLGTKDDVIVIDPESEYARMAELLGGEVVRVATGSNVHINPMDMDVDYADADDPISLKSDFIISFFEIAVGDRRIGLTPTQRSIIDKCVRTVYKPYFDSWDPEKKVYDKNKMPTLLDLQELLEEQSNFEAEQLATSLEMYTRGSLNLFSKQTNVDYDSRFVVYDIRDVTANVKALALLIVLDNVWNRIIKNKKEGRNTWFYIDEIYLLFKTETSANFLRELWKRARKWGGVPTGITQNVSDLLGNETARTMLSNCEFIQMLNQAPLDRNELAELLNISSAQLEYITNSSPGEGLIYTGSTIVPFVDNFPKNTRMYKAMTSRLEEVTEIERKEKEQSAAST